MVVMFHLKNSLQNMREREREIDQANKITIPFCFLVLYKLLANIALSDKTLG